MKKILLTIAVYMIGLSAFGQLTAVNVGSSANDGTGESLRSAFGKYNTFVGIWNAAYLYRLTLSGSHTVAVTTTGSTTITLPTSGTLVANPMTTAGDLILGGTSGAPSRLAAGITGTETYSSENYGATGTGNIVLSIGATLTTVNITDVIKLTPTASPPAGATEGMIYADTDHHLYYYNGTGWVQLDN